MRTNKYKLLVLSDLKDSMITTLESAVSLAKMINGEIVFFHVKNPSELVNQESQLSAIRTINREHIKTDNKIRNVVQSFSQAFNIKITYSFAFGNVKNEIAACMKEHGPDIVVLGKKKSKTINLIGDNITLFILKKHDGPIMLVDGKNALNPKKNLSLGILNDMENTFRMEFADDLIKHNHKPIKSFKVIKNSDEPQRINSSSDKKVIEFIFEQGSNSINKVSNYLTRNNINLLCMDRTKKISNKSAKNQMIPTEISEIISNLTVSLLVTGKPNYTVH